MIKTVWVDAYFQKRGEWQEYEEATGETKVTLFSTKPVTVKKKRWVILDEYSKVSIDGERLSKDTEKVLNELESEGLEVFNITPVISGRYDYTNYSIGSNGSANTCASWGYSVTEGVMISARKRRL